MGEFQASLSVYDSSWAPTEQIPERAIGTLLCADVFGTLDPTLRGRTEREILTVGYQSDAWRLTAYLQHYDWSLLNNFTFFLDDPVNGDQRRQYEERWTYGGRVERTFELIGRAVVPGRQRSARRRHRPGRPRQHRRAASSSAPSARST